MTGKIRGLVLDGLKHKDIQEILDIKPNTWNSWVQDNYLDFRTNLTNWENERMVKKAKARAEQLILSDDEKVATVNSWNTLKTIGGFTEKHEHEHKVLNVSIDADIAQKYGITQSSEGNSQE